MVLNVLLLLQHKHVMIQKELYFQIIFVSQKNNAIPPFIRWITLIVDYAGIWKVPKIIDLLEVQIALIQAYFQKKE